MSSFVHLRTHSQYSILDGSASISALANRAHQNQMTALALTDHGNLFGAIEFYKACKELKILGIIGCELYVAPQSRLNKNKIHGFRYAYGLTLLAKNLQGYHNLCKLSSKGYIEGFYYYPRVDEELLKQHKDGLICIAGAMGTRLAHEILRGTGESIQEHLSFYQSTFGNDYYLDIQRHQISPENLQGDGFYQESWLIQQYQDYIQKQEKLNQILLEIGQQRQIKMVATNDIHYMNREDWRAHEILLNIQSGEPCEIWEKNSQDMPTFRIPNPKRHTYASHEYYFKSAEEMQSLFADFPEAVENTLYISEQCKVEIDLKKKHYPVYLPPAKKETIDGKIQEKAVTVEEFLWKLCEEGIVRRYTEEKLAKIKELFPTKDPQTIVRERLEYEMGIIVPKGMGDYLLIVWDFIHWAKCQGVPMGPGRGSGAGSIVLYLIGITDIEPLRFHLFFERFINPERISYPDIDVDICMDRRGEVIAYTLEKYGKENVAQIITFGTMKAKMALKDVGRVLSLPLARVNQIAKLIPDDLNITLDKALEKDHELKKLYETDQEVTRLLDLARTLEGSIRNTGIHAAGIIISGSPLTDLIPICHAKDSEIPVTQFSMKPVEAVGMLKVDFLGLKTLTAIQVCVDAIWEAYGKKIDWINLPLDDEATFALLNQGKTLGVFQLESGGMQDLARQLHLDRFEEIIAVGALYRPGPMDMIPSFINRKHGREPIEYDHPWMQEILAETYGIMVYQEQVMQIASTA
jgi:DNA polymerase-3 subunit alpha